MLPRIEAGERLSAVTTAALAHVVIHGDEQSRADTIAAIERKARGEADPAPVKAEPRDLAGMGIGIKQTDGDTAVIADLDAWLGNA